jgi:hypothetical protein
MRIGPISEDTLGYALQRQSPESVFTLTCEIVRRLKHPAVHQSTALPLLTWIRALAYMLSLDFYHRQVRSHVRGPCVSFHDFAKRLGYRFVALHPTPVERLPHRLRDLSSRTCRRPSGGHSRSIASMCKNPLRGAAANALPP